MRALLPADERSLELLWSQDRVVKLEDNSLAGKDCLNMTHSNSVLSELS